MTLRRRASAEARPRPKPERELCVVHLVRHANGLATFQNFLDSYRRHAAGVTHDLAFVLKGFDDQRDTEPYRAAAAGLGEHWLDVADDGLDLGAYHRAALMLTHERLLFLNSFSVIHADDWLERMASIASDPQVGVVGASGSWGSRSSHARFSIGLGGPYRTVFDDPLSTSQVFEALTSEQEQPGSDPSSLARRWQPYTAIARQILGFPGFPTPHLRTNCFLIDRDLWLRVCQRVPSSKLVAYRLESGRRSITKRIRRGGRHVLVAGRDGLAYAPDEWPDSSTFWQGNQENLLVGDNQTRAYEQGSPYTRLVLSRYAWGPQAAPIELQLSKPQ